MDWLIYFIAGWFGSHWWGEKVDAPNPRDPHPWENLVAGIIAGVVAIYVVRAVGMSEPMPGMVLSIATGCVIGNIIGAGMGMMRGK